MGIGLPAWSLPVLVIDLVSKSGSICDRQFEADILFLNDYKQNRSNVHTCTLARYVVQDNKEKIRTQTSNLDTHLDTYVRTLYYNQYIILYIQLYSAWHLESRVIKNIITYYIHWNFDGY